MDKVTHYLNDTIGCLYDLRKHKEEILQIADILKKADHIFICGNGGSSATASHLAQDLRKQCGLKAYCLTDSTPSITAWANDTEYKRIFSEQLDILSSSENDIVIVISGSGNSPNIIDAIRWAEQNAVGVIAFVGTTGGLIRHMPLVFTIHVDSEMLHAEDWHSVLCHLLVELLNEDK